MLQYTYTYHIIFILDNLLETTRIKPREPTRKPTLSDLQVYTCIYIYISI